MPTRIIVDNREHASKVPDYLKSLGMHLEYRQLTIGDYVTVSGYIIERKEVHDFVNSLFSGRLFNQAKRILEAYDKVAVIVEGDFQKVFENMSNPRALWGAVSTLAFEYDVSVFFTLNAKQTADFIYTLTRRSTSKKYERPIVYKGVRVKTDEEVKLAVLSNLPGVGPKLAERLSSHFGCLRKVFAASVTDLTLVEGVGRTKAERIINIFESVSNKKKRSNQLKLYD